MEYGAYMDMLRGGFNPQELQDPPSKVIKLYLSATHTDFLEERAILSQDVYPKLREYCRQRYGLEFQVLDPHWGREEDWDDWSKNRHLCLTEVIECKKFSSGPNFVALLGQRYGSQPVPAMVSVTDFDAIQDALSKHRNRNTRDAGLLNVWYRKDTNIIPATYRLVPLEEGRAGQILYSQKHTIPGTSPAPFDWQTTQASLKRLIAAGVEYCLNEGVMTDDVAFWYTSSDLEKEVDLGLLRTPDPDNTCLVVKRDIVDLKNYIDHSRVSMFMEVTYNDQEERLEVEEKSANRIVSLKHQKVPHVLSEENQQMFEILWRHDNGVDASLHGEYMQEMGQFFETKIKTLIDVHAQKQSFSPLPALIEEVNQHWLVARDRSALFTGREEVLEVVKSYILSNDNKPLVVHGVSGSGKTALFAKAAAEVIQYIEDDTITVVRFIGTTASSCDTRQLLYNICLQLALCLGTSPEAIPNEYKELQTYFLEMLSTFPDDKNLLLFLDALHILVPQYNAHYLYWIPRTLKENVKIVLSTLPETHNILERLSTEVVQNENNFVELPPMQLHECMDMLNSHLELEKRCLHLDQQAVVREAFRICSYPLYVQLVYTQVRTWLSSTETPGLPPGMKEFIHQIIDRLELNHGKVLVSRALAYLTASTTGLSDCEMEDLLSLDNDVLSEIFAGHAPKICRVPSISWLRLKDDIKRFLIQKQCEGVSVYFWFHRMFVDITKSRYLGDESMRKAIHSNLADYNLGIWHDREKPLQPMNSIVERKKSANTDRLVPSQPLTFQYKDDTTRYNKRKYEQVPRHLYLSGRLEELNSLVLFSYEFLYNKTKALSLEHILADFVLNPGVEATLVERALRDAQPFMEVNIDNMAAEITGRLLSYYSSHPNIRKLIQECDTAGLKQCALIPNFPYHQVPGSPLRYTIQCQNNPTHFQLLGENSRFMLAKQSSKPLVEIFDLATGEPNGEVETSIGDMYLTPNGQYLIIMDHIHEKSIKVHATETGKYVGQLIPMTKVASDPKERYRVGKPTISDAYICFTVTTDRSYLLIADLEFCKFSEVIALEGRSSICEITPDARYVFCNAGPTLLAYDICTLEQTTSCMLEYRPSHMVFTRNVTKGFHINNHENKVYVMLLREGYVELMYKIPVEESFQGDKVNQLKVSNNQDMLLIIGKSNLLVYNISAEKITGHFTRPTDVPEEFKLPRSHYQNIEFKNADFSPDNKFVIATIFRNVYIWNVANNRVLTTLQAPVGIITDMYIPSDRGQIVTHLESSNLLHVWSLGDAIGHVGMLDRLTTAVQSTVFTSNDRTALVRCHESDEIGVLDMRSGQLVDLLTHESMVKDYNITTDGEYVVVALEDAKLGAFNKVWHISGRKIIYEYGNVPASVIPLETESTVISILQDQLRFKEPFRISQFKFRDGTFEEYQFDQTLPFVLSQPFITPGDKYLVVLSAENYDDTHAHYVNPTICAVSLQANVDICMYSAQQLRHIVQMRRILHIRPYADNSYTVIVIFTNEPDILDNEDGRKSRGYDYSFGFMIFDIAAGVVCQVIDNFLPPQTPINQVLFTSDVSICIDNESNIFDMATGYFVKQIHDKAVPPRKLALHGKVALYYNKCHMFAIRLYDGQCIGHVNVHGQISSMALCHDERTILLGCEDGSLISYVLIDQAFDDIDEVLPKVLSRQSPLKKTQQSVMVRSWDKVDFENAVNGPPYSRPPSAIVTGPNDKELLRKVRPLTRPRSRERPVSDTVLYSPTNSKTCVVM